MSNYGNEFAFGSRFVWFNSFVTALELYLARFVTVKRNPNMYMHNAVKTQIPQFI